MDDEAIGVAVALRLGIDPGSAHTCRCGANVDPSGVRIVWYADTRRAVLPDIMH